MTPVLQQSHLGPCGWLNVHQWAATRPSSAQSSSRIWGSSEGKTRCVSTCGNSLENILRTTRHYAKGSQKSLKVVDLCQMLTHVPRSQCFPFSFGVHWPFQPAAHCGRPQMARSGERAKSWRRERSRSNSSSNCLDFWTKPGRLMAMALDGWSVALVTTYSRVFKQKPGKSWDLSQQNDL